MYESERQKSDARAEAATFKSCLLVRDERRDDVRQAASESAAAAERREEGS